MLSNTSSRPFRLHCVTDDPQGIDKDVNIVGLPHYLMKMGVQFPKLFLFSREFEQESGVEEAFLFLDLDVVILNDLSPLLETREDLRTWRNPRGYKTRISHLLNRRRPPCPYNTSIIKRRIGTCYEVWDDFTCLRAVQTQYRNGNIFGPMVGVDQSWLFQVYGLALPTWGSEDGVCRLREYTSGAVDPDRARVVFFPGTSNPWDEDIVAAHGWIRRHYPLQCLEGAEGRS
jgi:hypothetical protein